MTENVLRPISQCGRCFAPVKPDAVSCGNCGSFFADARMIQATGLPRDTSVKLTKSGELKMNGTQIQSNTGMRSSEPTYLLGCPPDKIRVCRSIRVRYPLDVVSWDIRLVIDGMYQGGKPMEMFTIDDSGSYGTLTDISLVFHSVEEKHLESVGTIILENVVLSHGKTIYLEGRDAVTMNNYTSTHGIPMEWVVEFIEHDRD